jgi:hypothetical protein
MRGEILRADESRHLEHSAFGHAEVIGKDLMAKCQVLIAKC